jgi:hypothetical protein
VVAGHCAAADVAGSGQRRRHNTDECILSILMKTLLFSFFIYVSVVVVVFVFVSFVMLFEHARVGLIYIYLISVRFLYFHSLFLML